MYPISATLASAAGTVKANVQGSIELSAGKRSVGRWSVIAANLRAAAHVTYWWLIR
jgi:hypothetical protein